MWLRWVVSNLLSQLAEDKVRQVVDQAKKTIGPAVSGREARPEAKEATPAGRAVEPCSAVVLFSLGVESGGLIDRMSDVVTTRCATFVERRGRLDDRSLVVAESGTGCEAAAQAAGDVIQVHRPRWIVAAGFAAALNDSLKRGHVLMPDTLVGQDCEAIKVGFQIDPAVVEASPSLHVGRLLTVDRLVRHREEKEQLAAEYDAIACDMESMAVARVCREQQVGFLAVRVVSDQMEERLPPAIERMLDQDTVAAKVGVATRALFQRPGTMKDMWRLRETAIRASDRLAGFLVGVLPQLER